jgi:hypothetical protein
VQERRCDTIQPGHGFVTGHEFVNETADREPMACPSRPAT